MYIHIDFIRKADTPDARSIAEAAPEEARQQASNVFAVNGPSMPGSPQFEQFMIGNEYDERQAIGALHPAFSSPDGIPGAAFDDFGIESAVVGINPGDVMRGLDSDGTPFFNDARVHPDLAGGFDSMAGIVPVPVVHPSPLIAGDGRVQESGLEGLDAFDNASYGPVDFDAGTDE